MKTCQSTTTARYTFKNSIAKGAPSEKTTGFLCLKVSFLIGQKFLYYLWKQWNSNAQLRTKNTGKRGLKTDATFTLVRTKHMISKNWYYFLPALNICTVSSTSVCTSLKKNLSIILLQITLKDYIHFGIQRIK